MKNDHTASVLIKHTPLNLVQIARLFLEMLESSGGESIAEAGALLEHCRHVIRLGSEALRLERETVSFRRAVEETLRVKAQRAHRTRQDIRYCMKRLMGRIPGLDMRPVRGISARECAVMLERAFDTPTQRRKARAILSGVFTIARRRGWCASNPVELVERPQVKEKEITPLSLEESRRLMKAACRKPHLPCAAAVGLMLFCGVRPQEVTRLRWSDIDFEEKEVVIAPRHSKTGGGRHIALSPALHRLLRHLRPSDTSCRICPPNWGTRWKELRHAACFPHWTQDILRHTYASFHVKMYHDLATLQIYMGHSSTALLHTRYVNLRGVARRDAPAFWRIPDSCTAN